MGPGTCGLDNFTTSDNTHFLMGEIFYTKNPVFFGPGSTFANMSEAFGLKDINLISKYKK